MTQSGQYAPGEAAEVTGLSLDTLRYYERGADRPDQAVARRSRVFSEGDIAWIGVVACLREAGLGIADLQQFTALLRSEGDPASRVDFLRDRRAALVEHIARMGAALTVLDDKIAYYRARESDTQKTT